MEQCAIVTTNTAGDDDESYLAPPAPPAPPNLAIIFAMTGATFGFAWCLAKLAGLFITVTMVSKNRV